MSAVASRAGRRRRPELVWGSALFDSREAVDAALVRLYDAGVPRDLVEVAVTPAAARRLYGRVGRAPRGQAARYAGIGALSGLIAGAMLSLVLVAWPGLGAPRELAIVQLLGPNIMTIMGALVGGLVGFFVRRRALPRHARAGEAGDSAVVLAAGRTDEEAAAVLSLLRASGGREPRVETRGGGPAAAPE